MPSASSAACSSARASADLNGSREGSCSRQSLREIRLQLLSASADNERERTVVSCNIAWVVRFSSFDDRKTKGIHNGVGAFCIKMVNHETRVGISTL